jgi:L-iditol 2-dehydrogenase
VVGPGAIGILAAQVLRAIGADVVLVGTAADATRLAIAERLGLASSIAQNVDSEFDVVVEASGSEGGARLCLDAACPGGIYVQIGLFGRPVAVDFDRLVFKELTLRAGFASLPSSWCRAVELVEGGQVDLQPLVSRVVAISEWEAVFDDLRARRALKVVFDPRRA